MKKLFLLCLLILSASALAEEIKVKVSGMVCSMCAQGIEKKFKKDGSVEKLHVDMDNKIVNIKTYEGKNISDETIKKLISEAGYNVAEITRK